MKELTGNATLSVKIIQILILALPFGRALFLS